MTFSSDPSAMAGQPRRAASLAEWQRVWGGSARTLPLPSVASLPDAAAVQSASATAAAPIRFVSTTSPGNAIDRVGATRAYQENLGGDR